MIIENLTKNNKKFNENMCIVYNWNTIKFLCTYVVDMVLDTYICACYEVVSNLHLFGNVFRFPIHLVEQIMFSMLPNTAQ